MDGGGKWREERQPRRLRRSGRGRERWRKKTEGSKAVWLWSWRPGLLELRQDAGAFAPWQRRSCWLDIFEVEEVAIKFGEKEIELKRIEEN